MLKLTLTPGEADKVLEAAGKAYAKVFSQAVKRGLLKVYFYPSLDSMIAAAYVVSHAYYTGVRVAARMSVRPPAQVSHPSVLLGYPSLQLRVSGADAAALAVASGSLQGLPPPDAFYLEAQGSVTATMLLVTSKAGPRPPASVSALALSGLYSGKYVTQHGALTGLDKYLVDHLSDLGLEASMSTTLKVYRPSEGSLCEAVARTVNPYYPGLTGDPDACRRAVGDPGLYGKGAASLDKNELTRVLESLLDYMEPIAGTLDPRLFLSGVTELPGATPRDPREALDALTYAAEVTGDYATVISALLDPTIEYKPLEKALEDYAKLLAPGPPKPRRVRGPGWLRLYAVDKPHPPTLAWRILVEVKAVEADSVIVWELGEGEYVASPLQVEEALGVGGARRLVETRVASEEGFWLKLQPQA